MNDQEALLQRWFPDHPDVQTLLGNLGQISQVWDDLIDQDNGPVDPMELNRAFINALLVCPFSEFVQKHREEMRIQLEIAINTWAEANYLEANGELPMVTYTIRSALTPLMIRIAYLVHGGKAFDIAIEMRRAVFDEPYESYIDGLSKEAEAAGDGAGE